MKGKKELLARLMLRAGLDRLIRALRTDTLVIFGYHRISPEDRAISPFAEDVFGPTPSELEHAIVWLKEHVRIISESELIEFIRTGRGPGELSVMITFDDGYRDNYTLAHPILKKHGVPAVFFIPSKMIDDRRLGWWDLIAYLIKRTDKPRVAWRGKSFDLPREREAAIRYFHKAMQLEKREVTEGLVGEVAEQCAVEIPKSEVMGPEMMSWDELRSVASDGITVGSHTHSHRVLATLTSEEQREELSRSKAFIEEKLGGPIRSIAYPVGGYAHFTDETRRIAKECGYDLAYSFCTGVNRFGEIAPFDVKRIGPALSIPMLAGTTVLPEVFDWDQASGYGG
jgi:peptidoglycan/xylan/chitin deacetylase (PgdA/CDA1 family)